MPTTALPATPRVLEMCEVLDAAIGEFLAIRRDGFRVSAYESDSHAWALSNLLVRNVEGVAELARRDLVLLPAGYLAARSAFEAGVRLMWLLAPDDVFGRESRWIAMLGEGVEHARALTRWIEERAGDPVASRRREHALRDLHEGIRQLLIDRGHTPTGALPTFAAMCRSLDLGSMYGVYRMASQYTHATWVATELYQPAVGVGRQLGEFIDDDDWSTPMGLSWWCLFYPLRRALERWGVNLDLYPSDETVSRGNRAINVLQG